MQQEFCGFRSSFDMGIGAHSREVVHRQRLAALGQKQLSQRHRGVLRRSQQREVHAVIEIERLNT